MTSGMVTQLHHLVDRQAARRSDSPALTFKDATLTYAELKRELDAFAGGLTGIGLPRGERVGVYLDKRIETVVSLFGSSTAGGVFVPINPLLRPRQVAHIVDDCDVRVLVTSGERLELLRDELEACESVTHVIVVGERRAAADPARAYEILAWDDVCVAPAEGRIQRVGIDVDMAAILYTSGSTGKPKGVVLSHRNLVAGAESVSEYLENNEDDCILAVLPLSFDAGFSQLTTGFRSGAHVVLMNYLLPGDVLRLCARHRVTGLTCVPPLWIQLADQAWPPEASDGLRYFANTGGRMPRATLQKLRVIFRGAKPYLMYGLTEAFRSTYLDPSEVDTRIDSIGKAIPNAEILVARPDGTPCAPGEQGELVHRGALVAMGYWNDPDRTAERFKPAPARPYGLGDSELAVWSGDLVVTDDDGFLYFVSRKDEMIKTSGYRVSPTEIEEVVFATGLISDAAAVGVPHPTLGQAIALVVAGTQSPGAATALLNECKKQLPAYMVPAHIDWREAIPRNANGKYDRALLARELSTLFAVQ
jgi:acyl-CoA ligase (AMP-forming) (exosortase A-associated)